MKISVRNLTNRNIGLPAPLPILAAYERRTLDIHASELDVIATSLTALTTADVIEFTTSVDTDASLSAQFYTATETAVAIAAAGSGGGALFVYDPDAVTQTGNLYNSWLDMMTVIAALPEGIVPTVKVMIDCEIPSDDMPGTGWDFKGGSLIGRDPSVTTNVTVNASAYLDNITSISGGLNLIVSPDASGVLRFTALEPGAFVSFAILESAAIDHTDTTNAFLYSDDGDGIAGIVLSVRQSKQASAGALTGPLVGLGAASTALIVAVQMDCFSTGGLPDNWLAGGTVGNNLIDMPQIDGRVYTLAAYAGATTSVLTANVVNAAYVPTTPADWSGSAPANVREALDRLAAAAGPVA